MDVRRITHLACLVAGAAALCACGNAARFLPPGFVKYENIADDKPASPEIKAAIDARLDGRRGEFPVMSDQPSVAPARMPPAEQAALEADLVAAGEALDAAVADDRAKAEAERATDLNAARAEMQSDLAADREKAAQERRTTPAPPQPRD